MWRTLRRMAEDPSNPGDLAAFLAVVTILVVLFALTVFVVLMTVVWWRKREEGIRWRTLVAPGLKPPREYAWEYGLSALTAVTLAATMTIKAAVVDDALSRDATNDAGASVAGTVADAGREFLLLGQEEAARQVMQNGLERVFLSRPALGLPVSKWLLAACFVLLALYLARLLQLRLEAVRQSPPRDPESTPGLRKLALVGICLGLLLASPLGALDEEELLGTGMYLLRRQQGAAVTPTEPACRCEADPTVVARIAALESALRALGPTRGGGLVQGPPQPADTALQPMREGLAAAVAELSELRDSVAALANRSSLLVLTDPGEPYLLADRRGSRRVYRTAGLHLVSEGPHRIEVRALRLDTTVTLVRGQVVTLDFRGRNPPIR